MNHEKREFAGNSLFRLEAVLNGNIIERYDNGSHLGHSVGICPNKINIQKARSKLYGAVNLMLINVSSVSIRLAGNYCLNVWVLSTHRGGVFDVRLCSVVLTSCCILVT
jgi:hypothetical protein